MCHSKLFKYIENYDWVWYFCKQRQKIYRNAKISFIGIIFDISQVIEKIKKKIIFSEFTTSFFNSQDHDLNFIFDNHVIIWPFKLHQTILEHNVSGNGIINYGQILLGNFPHFWQILCYLYELNESCWVQKS